MVATREIRWMRAITAASAGSASLISVVPASLTAGTYRASRSSGQRITRRTLPVTALTGVGAHLEGPPDQVGVVERRRAVRVDQRVLEADAGRQAESPGVRDERPAGVALAVQQPRPRDSGL